LCFLRDEKNGIEALKDLKNQTGAQVRVHQLDINDEASVKKLAENMKKNHGGIDILINNAATAFDRDSKEPFARQAEVTIRVNYWNTKRVCELFCPLLKDGARVVNVSSHMGHLAEKFPDGTEMKKRLGSPDLRLIELDNYMDEFVASAKAGNHDSKGYPSNTYVVSKVGLSAYTIIKQREFDATSKARDIVFTHANPGYVSTRMSNYYPGGVTPAEGARSSIFGSLLPPNTDLRGAFIWDDCTIKQWTEKL